MKNGYVTYSSDKLLMKKRGAKKVENEYGMPNKNFEIQFDFKTKSRNTALFSIEDSGGSHDRHIYIKNGKLYHRVWPGGTHLISRTNFADGNWHTLKLISEKGQPIITLVDDKRQRNYKKVDQSNFSWATKIVLGKSKDMGNKFF